MAPTLQDDPEWMAWIKDPAARLVLASIEERLNERNAAIRAVCRHPENQCARTLKQFVDEATAISVELHWHEMAFLRFTQTRERLERVGE